MSCPTDMQKDSHADFKGLVVVRDARLLVVAINSSAFGRGYGQRRP